jgi:alpha/beta superfamily hydrolase
LFLEGPTGRLEALLNAGTPDATHAALVCHPHPVFGGTLHNKVVFHAMKALNNFGFPVLRFNFRGAGLSEGEHDHGNGETEDVRAALDWLEREYTLPIIFAGFSFGAAVGLRVACPDDRVKALIGLGTHLAPVDDRNYDFTFFNRARPKLSFQVLGPVRPKARSCRRGRRASGARTGPIDPRDHFQGRLRSLANR